ncbi:MAG TPA: hypothetical protein VGK15_05860 [Candidatus Limnocylindria bacterium]|jgi:hypothetical protein
MNERDKLIDEAVLRRALRLEDDERAPRFDVAAVAALGTFASPSPRVLVLALVAAALTGLVAVAVWAVIFVLAPTVFDDLVTLAMPGLIAVATLIMSIAEVAAQPVVPLSLIAALGVAVLHSLRERREYAHVDAS